MLQLCEDTHLHAEYTDYKTRYFTGLQSCSGRCRALSSLHHLESPTKDPKFPQHVLDHERCWSTSVSPPPLQSHRVVPSAHASGEPQLGVSLSREISHQRTKELTMRSRVKEPLVEKMKGTGVTAMEHPEPWEKPADVLPLLQKVHRKQQPWLAMLC